MSAGRRSPLARLEAIALIAAAIYALWFQVRAPSRTVSDADYQQVAQVLAREARPGDAVLLYPWWTERARLFVPTSVPVVGYLDEAKDDLTDHPRLWVLAEPEQPRSDLDGFLKQIAPGRAALGEARRFGKLWLRLYSNDRFRPTRFSAVDAIATARVYLERGDQRADCTADGGVHHCPLNVTVAPEWHELFYAPHRCLTMHPPGQGARLVAEFDGVPSAPLLRLSAGIIWEHAWKHDPQLTPVEVRVEDFGQPIASLTIAPGQEGPRTVDVPLSSNGPHRLRVTTESQNPEDRDLCVQLTAYGDAR